MNSPQQSKVTWKDVPTRTITAAGVEFAYRELGHGQGAITFIEAMGLAQVDLVGFSMGGMIAQEIALMEPHLVCKMIIAGTGRGWRRGH